LRTHCIVLVAWPAFWLCRTYDHRCSWYSFAEAYRRPVREGSAAAVLCVAESRREFGGTGFRPVKLQIGGCRAFWRGADDGELWNLSVGYLGLLIHPLSQAGCPRWAPPSTCCKYRRRQFSA
jgi:hypothetical protein